MRSAAALRIWNARVSPGATARIFSVMSTILGDVDDVVARGLVPAARLHGRPTALHELVDLDLLVVDLVLADPTESIRGDADAEHADQTGDEQERAELAATRNPRRVQALISGRARGAEDRLLAGDGRHRCGRRHRDGALPGLRIALVVDGLRDAPASDRRRAVCRATAVRRVVEPIGFHRRHLRLRRGEVGLRERRRGSHGGCRGEHRRAEDGERAAGR
jgi:hypothetical protein